MPQSISKTLVVVCALHNQSGLMSRRSRRPTTSRITVLMLGSDLAQRGDGFCEELYESLRSAASPSNAACLLIERPASSPRKH